VGLSLLSPSLSSHVAPTLLSFAPGNEGDEGREDGGGLQRVVLIIGTLAYCHLEKLKKARKRVHRKSKRERERV
jgi:hypothetical protein